MPAHLPTLGLLMDPRLTRDNWIRDRLRDTYSRDTLEEIAYLSLLWLRGDEAARERLAVLLGELGRVP